jgi:hypothetical protein
VYFRITNYRADPANHDALLAKIEEMRDQIAAIPGLHGVRSADLGDGRYITIAMYGSKEEADAAADSAKAVWGGLADHLDMDSLTIDQGEVIFSLNA